MKPKNRATEDQLLAFAAGGEQVVSLVRLLLVGCIFIIPIFQLAYYRSSDPDLLTGLTGAGIALALALLFYLLALNSVFQSGLPYVTSVIDITLVSCVLVAFLVRGEPMVAVNSRVVWEIYLIAIGATALRPRRGIVTMATLVAIGEYLAIVLYADLHWDLNAPQIVAEGYGNFDWSSQVSRLVLMAVAGILAAALVKRIVRVSLLAGTDSLTGVFNRTYFDIRMDEEVQRARRYHRPLTLVMVDIDRFKTINDTFGHDFGDEALVRITHDLSHGLRASDILFRYGGDELAILMPETSAQAAHRLLARLHASLRKLRLADRKLTVSIGISTFPDDAHTVRALVQIADNNLYTAKQRGRDCIVGTALPAH